MMQCQICGDTQGPFQYLDIKNLCDHSFLVCEDCWKECQETKKEKKFDYTNCTNPFMGERIEK